MLQLRSYRFKNFPTLPKMQIPLLRDILAEEAILNTGVALIVCAGTTWTLVTLIWSVAKF